MGERAKKKRALEAKAARMAKKKAAAVDPASTDSDHDPVRWLHWVNLKGWNLYMQVPKELKHTHTHTIQNQQSTKFYSEVRAS